MPRRLTLDLSDEERRYFEACARIRDIHPRSLIRRVLRVIAEDQLVAGILDDEDDLRRRHPSEHRYRPSV